MAKAIYKNKLYCKENNILQLPLFFFSMSNKKKMVLEWEHNGVKCKLTCACDRGLPGGFEQDVYAVCMHMWIQQGRPKAGLMLQYADIAKIMGKDPKNWVSRIKRALLKLGAASYELTNCFVNPKTGKTESIEQFRLFSSTKLIQNTKRGRSNDRNWIYFPPELSANLELRYYQYLNLDLYFRIKSGVPRRLYEYLEKRNYHQTKGAFAINEKLLCLWIPVTTQNATVRRKTIEKAAKELKKVGYLSGHTRSKDGVWRFYYSVEEKANPVPGESVGPGPTFCQKSSASAEPQPKQDTGEIGRLVGLLQRTPKTLISAVQKYYNDQGYDYVYRNIAYANKFAKSRYTFYLKRALKEDWGSEYEEKDAITFPETPEGKWAKRGKDLFDSWSEDMQAAWLDEFRRFMKDTPAADKTEELISTGKLWKNYGPQFMTLEGLINKR